MSPEREDPPVEGDERTMLVGWLDFHRDTLALKTAGLSPGDFARRPVVGSALSLLGLVRHLTEIERTYFRRVFAGEDLPDLAFGEDPFGETPGGDFDACAAHPPEEALAAWQAEVDVARSIIRGTPSLDDPRQSGLPLRFWLVKTLNEYARHNGHADIVRELLDGTTGE
ncbi:MAG TPA: DinB family protein [Acidimicrobiales bacterium]|nr:DinB family protein [Acidimicrobiales bacterium]